MIAVGHETWLKPKLKRLHRRLGRMGGNAEFRVQIHSVNSSPGSWRIAESAKCTSSAGHAGVEARGKASNSQKGNATTELVTFHQNRNILKILQKTEGGGCSLPVLNAERVMCVSRIAGLSASYSKVCSGSIRCAAAVAARVGKPAHGPMARGGSRAVRAAIARN